MNFLRNLIQGTHSAHRAESDQKKKGGVPPPGSADPPCKLEEEADVQQVTNEPQSENLNGTSLPGSPSSLHSESSPESVNKDCETPSTTEETSFASCLTETPSSLSENISNRKPHSTNGIKGSGRNPESSVNSDSEYESAEEVDLPPDPNSVVTQQPSSEKPLPAFPNTEQVQDPELSVITNSKQEFTESHLPSENSIKETSINDSSLLPVVEGPAENGDLVNNISESLVTVTKSEVVEESSTKTVVQEEVTEVISSPTVLSKEVVNTAEVIPDVPLKNTDCLQSQQIENVISKVLLEGSKSNESEVSKVDLEHRPEVNCVEVPKDNLQFQSEKATVESPLQVGNEKVIVESQNYTGSTDLSSAETSFQGEATHQTSVQQSENFESKEIADLPVPTEKPPSDGHLDAPLANEVSDNSFAQSCDEALSVQCDVNNEDLPIPPKRGYSLDFLDNLDDPSFNPFATKTAVRNTPPPSPEAGRKLPPLKPAVKKKKEAKSKDSEPPVDKSDCKSSQDSKAVSEVKVEEALAVKSKPIDESKQDQVLEVEFGDTSETPRKPPPRLSKKSVPNKKPAGKAPAKPKVIEKNNNKVDENTVSGTESKTEPEEDIPIPPSKGYNLDFLDDLDDPNFNPFATKCSVSNSPPKEGFTLPNEAEDKPKAKLVSPKKSVPKKGFSVVKNKAKGSPSKQDQDLKTKTVQSLDSKSDTSAVDAQVVEDSPKENFDDLLEPPKKGYNLDFLDNPDFDPFKSQKSLDNQTGGANVEVTKLEREVVGAPSVEEPSVSGEKTLVEDSPQQVISKPDIEDKVKALPSPDQVDCSPGNALIDSDVRNEGTESIREENSLEKKESSVLANKVEKEDLTNVKDHITVNDVSESEQLAKKNEHNSNKFENSVCENSIDPVKSNAETDKELDKRFRLQTDESESQYERELGVPKVPSIGTIGHLDSLEFAQLLGNEASRLAEEFMNCSADSGLPDSDDSAHLKSCNTDPSMADKDLSTLNRLSAHLDENVNPFQKNSKLQRSPPLGKRDVCGADGGDGNDNFDPFKPRRSLLRENAPGEDRQDTSSLDDDSGIALGTRSDLETDVNHSEAGPEIATGLTSSDLQCASQSRSEDQDEEFFDQITDEEFLASEAFFKEATDIENQLRKGLMTTFRGSQSKLSGDEVTPTKDKSDLPSSSTPEHQNKPVPSTSTPVPPHEERSAPEGTSSPTPRPSDTSEHKSSSSRPNSIPPEGYMTAAEVQKLLKQQELQFEEKLLRAELASGEKEKKLRQAMKDEQKEISNMGETVSELTQSRDALLKLVGQYKGMLASLVSEKEKEKQMQEERIKVVEQEKLQALEDLANVEVAFSDVHRKYERTKQVVDTLKRNEETLRGAVTDYEGKLQKQEQKFIEFQKHAEEKIQLANEEFEAMRRANDQEMTKMAALLKKAEMKIMSLQDSNDRKTRENQELTQLCDDLINKVGTSH